MIEMKEGDYVIRSGGKDFLRVKCDEDGFTFIIPDKTAPISDEEVKELVDWIHRRLREPTP